MSKFTLSTKNKFALIDGDENESNATSNDPNFMSENNFSKNDTKKKKGSNLQFNDRNHKGRPSKSVKSTVDCIRNSTAGNLRKLSGSNAEEILQEIEAINREVEEVKISQPIEPKPIEYINYKDYMQLKGVVSGEIVHTRKNRNTNQLFTDPNVAQTSKKNNTQSNLSRRRNNYNNGRNNYKNGRNNYNGGGRFNRNDNNYKKKEQSYDICDVNQFPSLISKN
ncbi:hypothetical protein A3Q56_04505 [Intoshia linei]|uniref:Uncharacterized protein n=1 Tax=Intoshia linei TaxID=1819745 RepID=A0A177B2Y4_9BILA|nr:hypothetical protein A3Q56_04505 [Intoshia linei]